MPGAHHNQGQVSAAIPEEENGNNHNMNIYDQQRSNITPTKSGIKDNGVAII